uniref:Histamine H3 receptor n=1 Tax=Lepisosteus oculatus TaxID=7918 RepID=W5M7L9_LEPOC
SRDINMNQTGYLGKLDNVFSRPNPTTWTVLIILLIALLVVVIVLGNALVILAFVAVRNLRTQSNFFLLNLAISDFLVKLGVFCIPLYVPYMLTGRWTFGKTLCKLWLVMDYLMCTSSVFNIVLISYDRFLSVTDAVTYRTQQGKTSQAITKMAMGWLLAFLLYGPAIIAWEHIAGYSLLEKEQCYPEFYFNWYFLITASTVEFFMPFISVTFFNLCIYLNIHRRACSRRKLVKEMNEVRRQPKRASLYQLFQSVMFVGLEGRTELLKPSTMALRGQDTTKNDDGKTSQTAPSNESWIKTVPQMYGQRSRLLKDKKVAKSLAIIVCTFGVCWAPYTLLMIIRAAFNDDCVPRFCYEVTFWLLWVNSAINPFLYPLCHKAFRKAFTKLLCPKEFNV